MKRFFSGLLLVGAFASSALAGWNSGGGLVIKDAENPWFLQNTPVINTCVVVNRDYFHMKDEDSNTLINYIQEAWSYWQQEFSRSFVPGNYVRVATQNLVINSFIEVHAVGSPPVNCPSNTDLTLQFGYLNQEQLAYFNNQGGSLSNIVSAAVRTSYDQVTMKGKGFIYLAADSGPYSAQPAGTISMPWLQGAGYLTLHALRHEFGHMAGLQHQGIGSIMAVNYPEMLITPNSSLAGMKNFATDLPFFEVRDNATLRSECYNRPIASLRPMWVKFFQIPSGDSCFKAELRNGQLIVSSGTGSGNLTELGRAILDTQVPFKWQDAVHIYLPAMQTVFNSIPQGAGIAPFLVGPMIKINEFAGTFVAKNNAFQRRMTLTVSPLAIPINGVIFSGDFYGQWIRDLDFDVGSK